MTTPSNKHQQQNKSNQGAGNKNNPKSAKKNSQRNDRTFGSIDPEMSKDFDFEMNNKLFDKGVSSCLYNNKCIIIEWQFYIYTLTIRYHCHFMYSGSRCRTW